MSNWPDMDVQALQKAHINMQAQAGYPIRRSLTERLNDERLQLSHRIAEIDQVLEGLAKHPEVESLINLVAKYT